MARAAIAACALVLLAGCGSSDDDSTDAGKDSGIRLIKAGELTTCTHLPYPPFQSAQDGKVVGFDVDLIDLVAKELGVKQGIVDTPTARTPTRLASGERAQRVPTSAVRASGRPPARRPDTRALPT